MSTTLPIVALSIFKLVFLLVTIELTLPVAVNVFTFFLIAPYSIGNEIVFH